MRALAILGVLTLVTACGGNGDDMPSAGTATNDETTEMTTGDPAQTARCTNEAEGFSIEYPDDWHTNAGDVAPTCSFFHPQAFELPEASEAIGIAIRVDREPVEFERIAGDAFGREVLEREETTVAGRPAVRVEYESTGEALLDAGTRGVDYLVDLGGGETLVASTVAVGGLDFEENVRVLDEMVKTVRLTR